ncbi:MAG: hypothetical protein R3F31_21690 [Verrucomicrobiales bacterium]
MHLRYSSEARGYSLMLCFLLATLWFSGLALKTGRWRWWLLFGLAEFLTMFLEGHLLRAGLLNLVLVLILLFAPLQPDRPAGRARWVSIGRWTAASLLPRAVCPSGDALRPSGESGRQNRRSQTHVSALVEGMPSPNSSLA